MSDPAGRILVVDDEPGMREGCRRLLAAEGHEVTLAESGEQAVALFAPGRFDVALIDLKMPGISGIEVLERLRRVDPECTYLIVTAYASLETAVTATRNGAYDYVPKPFTPDELISVVNRALALHRLRAEAAELRRQAERNLLLISTEQSRIRTIIHSMADGVMVTNRDRMLVLYNPALLRLLGLKADLPDLGKPPSPDLFPPDLLALMEEMYAAADVSMLSRELAGGPPYLAATISVVRDEARDPLGLVAVIRDVTEAKSLQQRMGEFVSLVAHELRSPLGAIAQYLDVILAGIASGSPDKERQILARCRARVQGLSQLVRDLLDFSRLGHGASRRMAPLDLREVLEETAAFSAAPAAQKQVSVALRCPSRLPLVEADREEMRRLFTNLVDNAIKYNRQGGSVEIVARDGDGFLVVEVIDTGVGIPRGAIARLGETFYRVRSPETLAIPGTGLGLSICKQILDAHNGHLEVESEQGRGSTFRVLLPKSQWAAGPAQTPAPGPPDST